MRLYKYVKVFSNLTQSEVDKVYNEGRIKVNNEIKPFSYLIRENDVITFDNKEIKKIPFSYFLYYKPKGIISDINKDEKSYINYINLDIKLMPVGRLDRESEGLMILSNDGKYIYEMNNSNIEKEYIVTLEKKVSDNFLNSITKSFIIRGKKTKEMIAVKIDDYNIKLILFDGRYHQIRKACINCDNKVINLKRMRIGKYTLSDMKENELREIKKG